jgi:N-acyl-L-homoserine lactone synthetase
VTFARIPEAPEIIAAFSRFRKELFVDKFGWQLPTMDGSEQDEFDTPNAEYAVMIGDDRVVGGFRAIRTDHEYLGRKIFPQLASMRLYPRRKDIWEISRFGVLADAGSPDLALINYSLMFRFASRRQASALVAIADPVYERYLRTMGIRTRRYGPPQRIGFDRRGRELCCVAGEIPIADQAPERLADLLQLTAHLEIDDAVVQGPQAISA